ncbi:cortistatin [Phyllobates terribilis]|uniref:cortistatin n=1 Tax=Phyllobates terribilis TaxID=111132 RepID=UPI003CCB732D
MCQSLSTTQLLLVLLASCTVRSTAPMKQDRGTASDSMDADDDVKRSNLLNVLAAIFERQIPESDAEINFEGPELPFRPQRSMYNPQLGREKTTCKNFFWKTFSAC